MSDWDKESYHFWRKNVRPGTTFGPFSRKPRSPLVELFWIGLIALLMVLVMV